MRESAVGSFWTTLPTICRDNNFRFLTLTESIQCIPKLMEKSICIYESVFILKHLGKYKIVEGFERPILVKPFKIKAGVVPTSSSLDDASAT